jgi:hypothetical protein
MINPQPTEQYGQVLRVSWVWASLKWRTCSAKASVGAKRAQARACKADTGDLEELTTAEIHRALLIRWNPVLVPGFIWTITVAAEWLPTFSL